MYMTFEQQKNYKALSITVAAHLLLLLFFLGFKYTMPLQAPVEELGMEVNLGTSDDGQGDDQPEIPGPPGAEATVAPAAVAASEQEEFKELHTDNSEQAPAVVLPPRPKVIAKKEKTPQPPREKVQHKPKAQEARPANAQTAQAPSARYLYPGATGQGGNGAQNEKAGSSEGIGSGKGDMGVPGGTPGATNYTGLPGGGGTSIVSSISGRNIVSRPDPKAEFREGGKVVIRVTVDREGTIIDKRVVSASNPTIRELALAKLKSVKFNKSETAPAEQFGNITFSFKSTRN